MNKRAYKKVIGKKILATSYGVWCTICRKYGCGMPYHYDPVPQQINN